MPHSGLERLQAEVTELVKEAFALGVRMERERVRSLLSADVDFPSDLMAGGPKSAATRRPGRRARGISYSGPIGQVRKALAAMTIDEEGVDAVGLLGYLLDRDPESEITEKRVRGALKQLSNTGEVIRASRGRYLPRGWESPPATEEKPGDEAPGPFDLAAE
jgi:hypothetical protein